MNETGRRALARPRYRNAREMRERDWRAVGVALPTGAAAVPPAEGNPGQDD